MDSNDHDLLIRIDTKMDIAHESFLLHIQSDAAEFSALKKSISAAHKRMDWILVSVILGTALFIGSKILTHS